MDKFKSWLLTAKHFTNFHNRCIICSTDLFDSVAFCDSCKKYISYNNGKTCVRCGSPIYGDGSYCEYCSQHKEYFNRAYSAFIYDKGIKKIIHSVKFGNNGAVCYQLGYYLAYLINTHKIEFDAVCFVPMTKKAIKKRGYNQAKLLAQSLCEILGNNTFCDVLIKLRDTVSQAQLSRKERLINLNGVFDVTDKDKVKGKRILLVDDVKTTGATLNECSKVLLESGSTEVNCVTVASGIFNVNTEVDSNGAIYQTAKK